MNIIVDNAGQTCNRFFAYLYYLKRAIANAEKLKVLVPDITIEDYPYLQKNEYVSFPLYAARIANRVGLKRYLKILAAVKRIFLNQHVEFVYPIVRYLSFGKLNLVVGHKSWYIDENYSSIRLCLQNLFRPRKEIQEKVDTIYSQLPVDAIRIGVHIRWGDYKYWRNGQYYFTEEEYLHYMKAIVDGFPSTQKIVFYISTNGNIVIDKFKELHCILIQGMSVSEDLYALSKCRYIIGPLSSFSTWVSVVYNIPLYCIENKDGYKAMKLSQFSPAKNFQKKENGYIFPRGEYAE